MYDQRIYATIEKKQIIASAPFKTRERERGTYQVRLNNNNNITKQRMKKKFNNNFILDKICKRLVPQQ